MNHPRPEETGEDDIPDFAIRAAGGLLWKGRLFRRLAVIRRHRYGDWCLPKGKLDDGETFAEAAAREVREETGMPVRLGAFAGEIRYQVDGRPKVVRFWHMRPAGPAGPMDDDEVAEVRWLRPRKALALLDYPGERRLVAQALGRRRR
ncbi:NUDIX hydrolase [Dissulfurirhabdus thermomarina]|uniref:NUDIX hydrolase n=1 Tax=Dissulfurirhabdus thermomarina TaxID=1765737 RepID=A0A6N9TMI8_DISTH|nr:NUDIX hydrolase [Dissulfurirhabdus thermomarina]NDY41650.1 NUDIX hydrolase [Dissulfurirhabdus thermomarina]NMX24342.1 NUDIX hydrolase [Dissulfurirhabdus thermomarina]